MGPITKAAIVVVTTCPPPPPACFLDTPTLPPHSGGYATVKRAVSKVDASEWAVKIVDKRRLTAKDAEMLAVEVQVMLTVRPGHVHPSSPPTLVLGCTASAPHLRCIWTAAVLMHGGCKTCACPCNDTT